MRNAAVLVLALAACGRTFNGGPVGTIIPPQGGTVDGHPGPTQVDKRQPHEVVYADGQRCVVDSSVGIRYLLPDVFLTVLIGVVVDASSGAWRMLDDNCPGVV